MPSLAEIRLKNILVKQKIH